MKLHLPLSLRSALLAACAGAGVFGYSVYAADADYVSPVDPINISELDPGDGAAVAERTPAELTWIGDTGVWQEGDDAGVWSGDVDDTSFHQGDSVLFNKDATVTVKGVVSPADIVVDNADGTVVTINGDKDENDIDGQIAGAAGLTKRGEGELALNLDNAYTGGTVLEGGKITAGAANALGTGGVQVKGGTLNLGSQAIGNDITVTGSATISNGEAYTGKLTLDMPEEILHPGTMTTEGGGTLTLDESLNLAQNAELRSGTIDGSLTGVGGIVVKGDGARRIPALPALGEMPDVGEIPEPGDDFTIALGRTVTLRGAENTFTGGVEVDGGALTLESVGVGTGDIVMKNGGRLYIHNAAADQPDPQDRLEIANNITVAGPGAEYEASIIMAVGVELSGNITANGHAIRQDLQYMGFKYDVILQAFNSAELSGDVILNNAETSVAASTISGNMTINGGVISMSGMSVMLDGDTPGTVETEVSGSLTLNNVETATLSGAVTISGDVTLNGGSMLVVGSGMGGQEKEGVNVTGSLTVNSGELSIGVMDSYDQTVNGELTGTLIMNGGALTVLEGSSLHGDITLNAGSTAAVADGLELTDGDKLTLGGAKLAADVTVGEKGELILTSEQTIDGALRLEGGTLDMSEGGLLTATGDITISGASKTTVHVNTKELRDNDNSLIVMKGASVAGEASDITIANLSEVRGLKQEIVDSNAVKVSITTAELTWDSANKTWEVQNDDDSGSWITDADDKKFYNQDSVTFDADGKGSDDAMEVEIVGEVEPGKITVTNGDTKFTGNGSIAGDADFIVTQDANLTIATSNSNYTGDITVDGTLTAGEEDALGSANVTVAGTLTTTAENALGGGTSERSIMVAGGTMNVEQSNSDYAGSIVVTDGGLLQVEDVAAPLGSGSVSIADSTFRANGATLANPITLSGKSSLMGASNLQNVTFAQGATVSGDGYVLGRDNMLTIAQGGSTYAGDYFTFAGGTLVLEGTSTVLTITNPTDFTAPLQGLALGRAIGNGASTIDLTSWKITPGRSYTLVKFVADDAELDPKELFTVSLPEAWMDDYATLNYNGEALTIQVAAPAGNNPVVLANLMALSRNKTAAYRALSAISASQSATGTLAKYAYRVAGTADPMAVVGMLSALSGEELSSTMSNQIEGNLAHLRRLRGYIGSGQAFALKEGLSAYVTGFNDTYKVQADASGPGFKRSEWGASAGVEARLSQDMLVGIGLSDSRSHSTPEGSLILPTRQREDAVRVDVYMAMDLGAGLKSVTSAGVGIHRYSYRRGLPDGELCRSTDMDGTSFNFMQELSYTICEHEGNSVSAYTQVMSSVNRISSFRENGADTASLVGGKRNAWATDISFGLRCATSFTLLGGAPAATAGIQGGVVVSVGDTTADLDLHYAGAPHYGYSVTSARRNRVGYNLSGDLAVPVSDNMAIIGNAGAVLRGDSAEGTASVGLRINF